MLVIKKNKQNKVNPTWSNRRSSSFESAPHPHPHLLRHPWGLSWTSQAGVKVGPARWNCCWPSVCQASKFTARPPLPFTPLPSDTPLPPHVPTNSRPRPPCHPLLHPPAHTLSRSLCPLSIYLYPPHFWCKDPGSTLRWRQIRPSRPCHRKTSHRKVATSSPFQLICRRGGRVKQGGFSMRRHNYLVHVITLGVAMEEGTGGIKSRKRHKWVVAGKELHTTNIFFLT